MKREVVIIDPEHARRQYLKDLVNYYELYLFLSWRDIIVRYKQAILGFSWALVRPLLNMVIFSFLFSRIANLPSEGIRYPLFVLAGLIPWQLFSYALADTTECLLANSNLINKVYFPRMIIPASRMSIHIIDSLVALVFLAILMIYYQSVNYLTVLLLPFIYLWCVALVLGFSLWLSSLTVQYRDFRFIVPFVLQISMYVSPVGYGTFVIPENYRLLFAMNPLVGIIDAFRWSIFGISYPDMLISCLISLFFTCLILITGFLYFRKVEKNFADNI